MVTIETNGLTKRYQQQYAVNNLTFQAEAGEIVGFLGPNGAGKTTTFRMLTGLITPTSGTARVFGKPVPAHGANRLGAMIEEPTFFPYLTGFQNLRYSAYAAGKYDRAEIEGLLRSVKLERAANKHVNAYSQGMRQRLGLARALLGSPRALLLDEPTNGLDPKGIAEMRELIRDIAKSGVTVIISSHILAELEKLVDRVIAIERGEVLFDGPLSGITSMMEDHVQYTLTATDFAALTAAVTELGYTPNAVPGGVQVSVPSAAADGFITALVTRGVALTSATRERKSLEDAYLALVDHAGPQ